MDRSMGKIDKIVYSTLTEEQWRALSVVTITRPASKDPYGHGECDNTNTPQDERMGDQRNNRMCQTCGKSNMECPSHFGIIELPFAVYNKLYIDVVLKILQSVCPKCSKARVKDEFFDIKFSKSKEHNRLKNVSTFCKNIKICPWADCGEVMYQFEIPKNRKGKTEVLDKNTIYYSVSFDDQVKKEVFSADNAFEVLSNISLHTTKLLGFNHNLIDDPKYTTNLPSEEYEHIHQIRPESFIFTVLPVLPPMIRPWVRDTDTGERKDDDLTEKYNTIIKLINQYKNYEEGGRKTRRGAIKTKADIAKEICSNIWTLIDNTKQESKVSSGGKPYRSLRCRMTKKDGHIQSNVAGKRVNFSARSVIIGGGIRLKNNELGVPKDIAAILTKQEFVRPYNIKYLQSLLEQGKINTITDKSTKIRLTELQDKGAHKKLRIGNIVERQLRDGDIVFFNRQPTLRIESMMSFRVKIVDCKAFMLGLCWTSSFNADFDGDEMNMHVPQALDAELDIMINARCSLHIVSSQTNSVVNGIVQDGLIGSYILTNNFKSKENKEGWDETGNVLVKRKIAMKIYEEIGITEKTLQEFLSRAILYYPEYVKKEGEKYKFNKKIPGKLFISILFPNYFEYSKNVDDEGKVIIKLGILVRESRALSKKTIGAKGNSIIHVLWKISPNLAMTFLSNIQQLTDRWLPSHGFSMGIGDCIATKSSEIAKILIETRAKVDDLMNSIEYKKDPLYVEPQINTILNSAMAIGPKIAKNSMNNGDLNALNVMRESGAKGSVINLSQITAFVGQQNVKGRRMKPTLSNGTRTLYCYPKGEKSPESQGFIERNYIQGGQGLTPQECFFHAMAGREGIISTSLKTADTGYIQKKISRKLEDVKTNIFLAVANANGTIISFLYGNDGMDPKKLIPVPGEEYPFFTNPEFIANQQNNIAKLEDDLDNNEPRKLYEEEIELLLSFISLHGMRSDVIILAENNIKTTLRRLLKKINISPSRIPILCEKIKNDFYNTKISYANMCGLIAASSLGEPTTQMALNLFHFAGVGEKDNNNKGVPYFNKLISATKVQTNKSCNIYIDNPKIKKSFGHVYGTESSKKKKHTEKCLKYLKKEISNIEHVFVNDVLYDYDLLYNGEGDVKKCASPTKVIKYKRYIEEYWSKIYKKLYDYEDVDCDWVIMLKFDVEKLFEKRINLRDIAHVIENESNDRMKCIYSDNIIGKIEVKVDTIGLAEYFKMKIPDFINEDNEQYFIIREVAIETIKSCQLKGVEGIPRVYFINDKLNKEYYMKSSGSNFEELLKLKDVDDKRTISENMYEIKEFLGIEAARRYLFNELKRVLTFDGTYINPRHISILVDAMTYTGDVTACSRFGIPRDAGPNAKITFEKPIENAMLASVFGEVDDMTSVAGIAYGITYNSGARAVSLVRNN